MKSQVFAFLTTAGVAVALAACSGLSQNAAPTISAESLSTSVAGTVSAASTAAGASTAAASGTTAAQLSTPVPTLPPPTEAPTATAVVSNPTAAPTATPATPDPNKDLGNDIYSDSFTGKSGWFWTFSDDKADFGAKDGALQVTTKSGNNTWRYVVRDDVTGGDQQIKVTTNTTACPGNDEFGIMYRATYNSDQNVKAYVYKLNCAGQARVEVMDGATITVLKDWEAFPAIKAGVATNTLTVWMQKDQFNFYANDQYLFSVTDSTLSSGFIGFYVQSHSGGGGALNFTDYTIKEVGAAAH
jgi:hypothetical protein